MFLRGLFTIGFATFLSGCFGQPFEAVNTGSETRFGEGPSACKPVVAKISPFATPKKVHIDLSQKGDLRTVSPFQVISNDTQTLLHPDKDLMGLIDLKCVDTHSGKSSFVESMVITYMPTMHPTMTKGAFNFRVPEVMSVSEVELLAQKDPCVLSVTLAGEGDDVHAASDWVNSDPDTTKQGYLKDTKADVSYDKFYDQSYGINKDVIIADLDTGVYFNHEDISVDNLWRQSNGTIGYNVLSPSQDAVDDYGSSDGGNAHGSKIAGIIGATHANSTGIMGVVPKYVKVMAVKYISLSSASSTDRVNGFIYAMDNGAEVINLSIGFSSNETMFRQLIEEFVSQKNGFVATSAGNDGQVLGVDKSSYPAVWGSSIPGLMTVGATMSGSDSLWSGSNRSVSLVEIAAPGGSVYTTIPYHPNLARWGNYYGTTSGTSFSSPIVAAAAGMAIALLKSHGIAYDGALIEDLITSSARRVSGLSSYFKDGKVLNMDALADEIFSRYPQIQNSSGSGGSGSSGSGSDSGSDSNSNSNSNSGSGGSVCQ
ncbi:MAG: S8 family serine peptidase [Pseudobdellovibrionaceae bacterium]|nr:MAG: S8 family serine peptidase [Pseudobdellovibrionaceae bacterium]